MKVLDVDHLQDGLIRNINRMNRLEKEMTAIQKRVEELTAMEDALKGEGGQALRDFYTSCHLPFLQYFLTFKEEFNTVLQQAQQALSSLEPVEEGHIVEEFLETKVEEGLTASADITTTLTDEANAIMDEVSDIVGLPKLDDTLVHESIADAKTKRDDTVEALHTFDSTQTAQLLPIETSIQSMKEWVMNVEGMFLAGLTDVDFPVDQWTSMAVGSEITKQLTAMGISVGNILSENDAALLMEQAVSEKVVIDEYSNINEVSDIAGTYYTLADGRILREFYGPSGALTYTFVQHIPKDKIGGAIESGEKFFSWMSTIADVIPGVSNVKAAMEGIFGVNSFTGDKLSGWERGLILAAIIGSPAVKVGTKIGKSVIKYGDGAFDKIKNVLNPEKVKGFFKKVYDDYIKSPMQKGYTYAKNYVKKLGDVKTPFFYEMSTPQGSIKVWMTASEVADKIKGSTTVQMANKVDGKIDGKGIDNANHPIRTYRNADLKKLEEKYTADSRITVEMPYVGKGKPGTNAEGWLRDKDFYWKEIMSKHPESLSKANKQKIDLGFSPINDKTFREHFPQYDIKELYNDKLIHHHVGGGGQAVAVPSKLHPGTGGIHNAEKAAGVWGNDSEYAELLEKFLNK